jgi:two-component system chemotaxis sensor kinase CheA
MTDDNQEYKEIYLIEARENLEQMNQLLVDLEHTDDSNEVVNNIFRIAHTFKGMSSTMGYLPVANLTHTLESSLDTIRTGQKQVTPELSDILFQCLDALEIMTDEIEEEGETSYDPNEIIQQLQKMKEGNSKTEEATSKEEIEDDDQIEEPSDSEEPETGSDWVLEDKVKAFMKEELAQLEYNESAWAFRAADDCQMASIRVFQIVNGLKDLGSEIMSSYPSMNNLENISSGDLFILKIKGENKEELSKFLSTIGELTFIPLLEITENEIASLMDRSYVEFKEREEAIKEEKERINKKANERTIKDRSKKKTTHIRVNLTHLDNLMNLIGELVINKGRLMVIADRVKDRDLYDSLESVNRIASELQEKIMAARLIPLDFHFNRFPRMVRDLSRKLEKDIEFVMKGGDIELDRTVIDEIGDPLVHLLRNAVDHGIESEESRIGSGKPRTGRVELSAVREKNTVIISVRDDGKGLDPVKLRKIAISKELITEERAAEMTDEEAQKLIFQPGFSTAKEVTDTSGRGVGMDAVSFALDSIGGLLSVNSEVGKGTTISMALPITMAIVQALLIESDDDKFAIPLSSVKEILDLKDYPVSRVMNSNVIVVRNKSIPLVNMNELLQDYSEGALNTEGMSGEIVILEHSGRETALLVDSLLGQQEIVIKSFGESLQGVSGFAGATILGDGSVILILDIHSLLSQRSGGQL